MKFISTLHCARNEKMLEENVAMLADAPLQEARVDILARDTCVFESCGHLHDTHKQ